MALGDSHLPGGGSAKAFQGRLLLAIWLVVVVFLLLLSRLYSLQIMRGEELSSKGRRNFVQRVKVAHDRGIIYDRYGRILADNAPTLDVQVIPNFLGTRKEARATLQELAQLIDLPADDLQELTHNVLSLRGLDRFQPILVKRDLTPAQVEAVQAKKTIFELDGVDIVEGRRRTYPMGSLAAHLIGYVNEIDQARLDAEIKRGNPLHYHRGDIIGRAGVEARYESELRGVDGYDQVVVDAKGRRQHAGYVKALLGHHHGVAPIPGHNVFLTIDAELQRRAAEAFTGRAGSVVAMSPKTGAILAMVSKPEFDPNRVSSALGVKEKERLDADPLKPWVDRAIQGQYAPGSTFKVVTALAALTQHVVTPAEKVFCPGYYRMGRHVWRCWKQTGHGYMNMHQAIKHSCDVYFYTMGGRMGINPIAAMGHLLGLGERTGFPLPGEKPGLMPDEAYHNRVDAATGGYQRGMAVNTAIGQGSVLVTPLQMAVAYATIANGGRVLVPQVVDHIETADFRVVHRFFADDGKGHEVVRQQVEGEAPTVLERLQPKAKRQVSIPPEYLKVVRQGLEAVTEEPGGTGYWHRSRQVPMAGKTGTAQVIRIGRERVKLKDLDFMQRDDAWFVSYAPIDDPQIVVAVLNEHTGHGGSQAEPIAVKVINAYFQLKQQRLAQSGTTVSAASAAGSEAKP